MEQYEHVEEIGKGSFGKVSKIRRKVDGRIMVWKELNYGRMNEKEKQQIVAEVNILRELKHPNIVKYYDRTIDKQQLRIYIVMEFCENGDLQKVIRKCQKSSEHLSEEFIWQIFQQIVSGLFMCHKRTDSTYINRGDQLQLQEQLKSEDSRPQKILHRDLKPGNIFLGANNEAKIGDFGLARVMNQESVFARTHVGTPYYMSPEQINEQKYNDKSDIWSLGCIVYEMAALFPPFKAQNHLSLAMKIKAGKFDRIPNQYSDRLWRVVCWMLNQQPEKRPDITELVSLFQPAKPTPQPTATCQCEARLGKKEDELKGREYQLQVTAQDLQLQKAQLQEQKGQMAKQSEMIEMAQVDLDQRQKLLFQILDTYNLPRDSNDLNKTLKLALNAAQSKLIEKNISLEKAATTFHSRQNSTDQKNMLLKSNRSDPDILKKRQIQPKIIKPAQIKNSQSSAGGIGSSQGTCSTNANSGGNLNQQESTVKRVKEEAPPMLNTGSPMEYLKRFKMQKQKKRKEQDSIVDDKADDSLNTDLQDDDDCTFRQTTFNPKQKPEVENEESTLTYLQMLKKLKNVEQKPTNFFQTFDQRDKTEKHSRNPSITSTHQTVEAPKPVQLPQNKKMPTSTRAKNGQTFFQFNSTGQPPKKPAPKNLLTRVESAQEALDKMLKQGQTVSRSRSGSLQAFLGGKRADLQQTQEPQKNITLSCNQAIAEANKSIENMNTMNSSRQQVRGGSASQSRQQQQPQSSNQSAANLAIFKKKILQQVRQQQRESKGSRPPLTERGATQSTTKTQTLPENLALLRQHVPSLNR